MSLRETLITQKTILTRPLKRLPKCVNNQGERTKISMVRIEMSFWKLQYFRKITFPSRYPLALRERKHQGIFQRIWGTVQGALGKTIQLLRA